MQNNILILGAAGNFGARISSQLVRDGYSIIIAGRNLKNLESLKSKLTNYNASIEIASMDANLDLSDFLKKSKPILAINTIGPFQTYDYTIAKACIENGVHYIDLADGRDFVANFSSLDSIAKEKNVTAISGASTVPTLSSAVLEYYKDNFLEIDSLKYGIAPGQKAERGLATTSAILGYVGKKLKPCSGFKNRYGWQDLYIQEYPKIGKRWMANCDIPDLDLFPEKYNIKKIQFSAGIESSIVHLGIWALSWMIRIGIPLKLEKHGKFLLKMSNLFNFLGTNDGGMHIIIEGKDKDKTPISIKWFILAYDGDGPYIPTIPAVILAKKIASGNFNQKGAYPCIAVLSLEEYLNELRYFKIETVQN